MKIVNKILIGFLLVILLVPIISYLAISSVQRIHNQYHQVQNQTIPVILALEKIKLTGREIISAITELCFLSSAVETMPADGKDFKSIQDEENFILSATESFTATLNGYRELVYSYFPDELEKPAQVFDVGNRLIAVAEEIVMLRRTGNPSVQLLEKKAELEKAETRFIELIDRLLAAEATELTERDTGLQKILSRTETTIKVMSLLIIVLALIVSLIISRIVARPINLLRESANRIGAGDLDVRVKIETNDEIGDLARTFNDMAATLGDSLKKEVKHAEEAATARARAEIERKKSDELYEAVMARDHEIAERRRTEIELRKSSEMIKMFAYSVAHDLKNPAIALHGLARLLGKRLDSSRDEKGALFCQQIMQTAEQIAELAEAINSYISTRESTLEIERVAFNTVIKTVREEFSSQLGIRGIRWLEPENDIHFHADKLSIFRVLRNLVDNALKYGGDRLGEIEVGYQDVAGFHIIYVRNDGESLETEDSEQVFMPFERRKTPREIAGAGLGLAIVKELAEQHRGLAWTEYDQEKGTYFYFSIAKKLGGQ